MLQNATLDRPSLQDLPLTAKLCRINNIGFRKAHEMKLNIKVSCGIVVAVFVCAFLGYRSQRSQLNKTVAVESTNDQMHTQIDEFSRITHSKEKRIIELTDIVKYNVSLRGRIQKELRWKDFPDVAKKVSKFYPEANQLLQIDIGETAMLVTRKSNFSTTGNFRMTAQNFMTTETSLGKVTVLVEFPEGEVAQEEWDQIRKDMKELTLQYMEKRIPEFLSKASTLPKASGITQGAVASLLFVDELGGRKGDDSTFFVYQLAQELALCSIYENQKVTATSWGSAYKIIFPKVKNDIIIGSQYCTNGGPWTNQNRVLSFEECMCGKGEVDPFLTADYSSKARFGKFLSAIDKKSQNIAKTSEATKAQSRVPASIE
jgi:hypothetical protein